MKKEIEAMKDNTDLWPWYWISYGEKCYAFAVVEAYPLDEGDEFPKPGTQLEPSENDSETFVGENGVKMIMESEITSIAAQNGDAICSFIAAAHAYFLNDFLPKK